MALSCSQDTCNENILWYTSPAAVWEEALPAGNGRMGAMVFGYTGKERIQFNENTLYSGGPQPSLGIDIRKDIGTVRRMLEEGRNPEAGKLMQEKWIGRLNEAYQPFGDLYLDFGDSSSVKGYVHSLDMENGVIRTSYEKDGVRITREVFVSYPDQCLAVNIRADKPVLDFSAGMSSRHPVSVLSVDGVPVMRGKAPAHAQRRSAADIRKFGTERLHPEYFSPDGSLVNEEHVIYDDGPEGEGMAFEAVLVPYSHKDGSLTVSEDGEVIADGCSEVTLLLYAATGFEGFDRRPSASWERPHEKIEGYMALMGPADGYSAMKERHIRDFSRLYDRVSIELPSSPAQKRMPTDKRLAAYTGKEDPGLVAQLFRFVSFLLPWQSEARPARGNGRFAGRKPLPGAPFPE